jgi:hypothetical protein
MDVAIDSSVPTGEFTVETGADAVGCAAGRFFTTPQDDGTQVATMTCESGPGEGDFTVLFEPTLVSGEDDEFSGPWNFEGGTGDFENLAGGGELSATRDVPGGVIAQTLSGEVGEESE